MLESLHELNMKFGYANDKVSDMDIIDIRAKAFDKVQKLRGRVNAIERRYKKELYGDDYYQYTRKEWKEDDDWLASPTRG